MPKNNDDLMEFGYWVLGADKVPVYVGQDVFRWGEFFNNFEARRVGRDEIGDVIVSTTFLGINHRFNLSGPPLLFETMIFGGEHDQEMWRYSTWDDAEVGHKMAVKRVKQSVKT